MDLPLSELFCTALHILNRTERERQNGGLGPDVHGEGPVVRVLVLNSFMGMLTGCSLVTLESSQVNLCSG